MKTHRLAKYFPVLEGEEFDLLVEDIKKNGQLEPIITIGDEILDGVNRYKACEQLGITPELEEYTGSDPLAYVISLNIRRRHMDVSQRAMLAQEMLPEFEREAKERQAESLKEQRPEGSKGFVRKASQEAQHKEHKAAHDAGKMFGVGRASVERAKRIKTEAPEKVADIIKGKTSVTAVDDEIRQKKSAAREAEREAKEGKKLPKQYPKAVKDYLDMAKAFKESLNLAVRCKKQGMFSPEAMQFVKNLHNQIRDLMAKLEE